MIHYFIFPLIFMSLVSCNAHKTTKKDNASSYHTTKEEMAANLVRSFISPVTRTASYPTYYAGSYLDRSKELIILFIGDSMPAKEDLIRRYQGENFIMQRVLNSRNILGNIMKEIESKLYDRKTGKEKVDSLNVSFSFILEKENKIIIGMSDTNAIYINRFKKYIIDSPLIDFVEGTFKPDDLPREKPLGHIPFRR